MSKHGSLLLIQGPQATIVDLPTEFSKTGKFTSPLPINPAAAPLSRGHFKCPARHARLEKSSNIHAPTLCTTCHGSGHAALACCRFCYLRICKRCAGVLGKCENDLESMLEELVRGAGQFGRLERAARSRMSRRRTDMHMASVKGRRARLTRDRQNSDKEKRA
jgi:hypothetical protein